MLRDLAVSGNDVLNVSFASAPLITALVKENAEVMLHIAEVLSYIDDKAVQIALMDKAMNSTGEDQILLLAQTANSAKRFGNKLEPRHVNSLVRLASAAETDAQATAAAGAHGRPEPPQQGPDPADPGRAEVTSLPILPDQCRGRLWTWTPE